MIKIIKQREHVESTTYHHGFKELACPSAGYAFPCDKDGNYPNPDHVATVKALQDDPAYANEGIQSYEHSYWECAQGECSACGGTVYLSDPLDNECDCGACYNSSGQSVIHSSQCDSQGEPYYDDF